MNLNLDKILQIVKEPFLANPESYTSAIAFAVRRFECSGALHQVAEEEEAE